MKLIDKDALVAMIDKYMYGANLEADIASTGECFNEEVANAKYKLCKQIKEEINTLEVKEVDNMPNVRFPHYKDVVEKVFGAGNLEFFEHEQAEQLVSLAKEELLKDLEIKEVDLEKEIERYFKGFGKFASVGIDDCIDIAKHFFELGLKAQYSSIGIPNIDDIFEEEGIDPNSKDAKIFKECYYMALEKLKAQKGE